MQEDNEDPVFGLKYPTIRPTESSMADSDPFLDWLDKEITAKAIANDAPRGSHYKSMDTGAWVALKMVREKYLKLKGLPPKEGERI